MGDARTSATIVTGPLDGVPGRTAPIGAGAWLVFEGRVRPLENDEPIKALCYEVYEPMAERQLERLASEVLDRHGLMELHVRHSRGEVAVGRCSLRVEIAAAHRAEGIEALGLFIDALKRDVPIWKQVVPG